MDLYKYCKREHLPTKGGSSIRVGTLFDYRRTDKYGELTSDSHEGSMKVSGEVSGIDARTIAKYPILQGLMNVEGEGKVGRVVFEDCTIESDDLYLFSAALTYSREDHLRWYEAEGYDACYRIHSPRSFFRAVTRCFSGSEMFLGVHPVRYAESVLPSESLHPSIVKRQVQHFAQREARAIWTPGHRLVLEPITLRVNHLYRYCETFAVLKM